MSQLAGALRSGGARVVVVNQLFPTPKELAQRIADLADIRPGQRVLEPSAGTGALLGAMGGRMFTAEPRQGAVVGIEINRALCDQLARDYPLTDVIYADFLDMAGATEKFDRIVMNPPFENGADIHHILHARTLLKPGGLLVAICANGPRQAVKLRPLADTWEELPAGTFAGTGARTVLLSMRKKE